MSPLRRIASIPSQSRRISPCGVTATSLRVSSRRAFSASPCHAGSLVDLAIAGPNAILTGIHNIGLSWSLAIPATAVLVRGAVLYDTVSRAARLRQQSRISLNPLIAASARMKLAHGRRLQSKASRTHALHGQTRNLLSTLLDQMVHSDRLGRKFGAPLFHWRGLINFGFLLAFTETIRMKCSSRYGLLSAIFSPFQWLADKLPVRGDITPTSKHEMAAMHSGRSQADHHSDPLFADGEALAKAGQLTPTESNYTPSPAEGTSPYFDPSMMTEGLPWATDLTVIDPSFMLPLALGATFIVPTLIDARKNATTGVPSSAIIASGQQVEAKPSFLRLTILGRIRLTFGLLFCLVACQMPAAVVLYLTSNMAVAALLRLWMDWKYPLRRPISICRRSVRLKVRPEWGD